MIYNGEGICVYYETLDRVLSTDHARTYFKMLTAIRTPWRNHYSEGSKMRNGLGHEVKMFERALDSMPTGLEDD